MGLDRLHAGKRARTRREPTLAARHVEKGFDAIRVFGDIIITCYLLIRHSLTSSRVRRGSQCQPSGILVNELATAFPKKE
jgi:hypothetical protein